jgi:D-alanine-D-alanine ligase
MSTGYISLVGDDQAGAGRESPSIGISEAGASLLRIKRPPQPDAAGLAGRGATVFWRPKGNLTQLQITLLVLLVMLPFAVVSLRILALPGFIATGTPLDTVRVLGASLTDVLSLGNAHEEMQRPIFSLLFIPTCALLAVLARLTLGIRVLGIRAILIALSFYIAGIVPSLVLIFLTFGLIALARPRLKRMGLPYFARVSTILGLVAGLMVVALIAGPWLKQETMWSVAFFPVVVLALLAEGVARTADREGLQAAQWRLFTTITLALVMAAIGYLPVVKALLLEFPELVLAQIAAIPLIAEFLDLRLLQEWEAKRSGLALPRLFSNKAALKVAVVRNRSFRNVIARLGQRCPEKYGRRSVQRIVDALREGGHEVQLFEGDMSLLPSLREYLPANSRTGEPSGLVFNLGYGIQGDARYTHVPAMLEMAGIAYTSASPLGHALALDKVVAKVLMQSAGIPTPAFCVMADPKDDTGGLRYPLIVKPRHESSSFGLAVVKDRSELEAAVSNIITTYKQGALVEEFIEGREVNVGLIGNNPVECLPIVEIDFHGRADTALTHEDKFKTKADEPGKICPAPLEEELAQRCRDISIACFLACFCRDYARVDIRISESGEPYVLEINSMATLGWTGSFVTAAKTAGYSFTDIICRIVEVARERYRTEGASQLMGLPASIAADPRFVQPVFEDVAPPMALAAGER